MFRPMRKAMRNTVPTASQDVGVIVLSGRRGNAATVGQQNRRIIK